MQIIHLALSDCLRAASVTDDVSEDTGSRGADVPGAAEAQVRLPCVSRVKIATRLFDNSVTGPRLAAPRETAPSGGEFVRIDTGNRACFFKEPLKAELPAFADPLMVWLRSQPRPPDVTHAYFANATLVARGGQKTFRAPDVCTARSPRLDERQAIDDGASLALRCPVAIEDAGIAGAVAVTGSSRGGCERQLAAHPSARAARIFPAEPGKPMVLAVARPVARRSLAGPVGMLGGRSDLRARANLVLRAGLDGPGEAAEVHRAIAAATDCRDPHDHVAWLRAQSQAQVAQLYRRATPRSGAMSGSLALTQPFGLTIPKPAAYGRRAVATCMAARATSWPSWAMASPTRSTSMASPRPSSRCSRSAYAAGRRHERVRPVRGSWAARAMPRSRWT